MSLPVTPNRSRLGDCQSRDLDGKITVSVRRNDQASARVAHLAVRGRLQTGVDERADRKDILRVSASMDIAAKSFAYVV